MKNINQFTRKRNMKLISLLLTVTLVGCANRGPSPLYLQALGTLPKQEPMCIIKEGDTTMIAKCNGLKLDDIFRENKKLKEVSL